MVIRSTHNWKSPGPDKVENFWIKQLTSLHMKLTEAYNSILKGQVVIPEWLTTGTTILLSKGQNTEDPKNYRPITCLPTMYKIMTQAISNRIYNHLDDNNILPPEQKGCRKGLRGCKDQLLVSKLIMDLTKKQKKNMCMSWIDYKKAFDSLPHSWIIEILNIYKLSPEIRTFLQTSMKNWKTNIKLYHTEGVLTVNNISIKRGIFQGDSLSPLLFCIALIPLTNILNKDNFGFQIDHNIKVSHLLYLDDLKIFTRTEKEMKQALGVVRTFSHDICMEFGLDKCASATFKRGNLKKSSNINLGSAIEIRNLDLGETYKYLGLEESDGINNKQMKDKLRKEYYRRVRKVLDTELCAKNKMKAINIIAVPLMTYSFGIVDWLREDIIKIDRKTRKLLTSGKIHHPKDDVDRMYIKRKDGG